MQSPSFNTFDTIIVVTLLSCKKLTVCRHKCFDDIEQGTELLPQSLMHDICEDSGGWKWRAEAARLLLVTQEAERHYIARCVFTIWVQWVHLRRHRPMQ
ncbi:hypothetical protein SRHO_G00118820 [Serrasalmus rhombeus]